MIFFGAQIAAAAATHMVAAPGPRWLMHMGFAGLFTVSVLDASVIPLVIPGTTDLLLLWLAAQGGDPALLAAAAICGSMLGGYTTWNLGRRGGEAALRRYLPQRFLKRIVRWVERHPLLAVFIPPMLPPPVPLSPFLLACGALGVKRRRFLVVFGAARSLRYALVAWLGAAYGRTALTMWSGTLARWYGPLLWSIGILMAGGLVLGFRKIYSERKAEAKGRCAEQTAASKAI